jgi:integrase
LGLRAGEVTALELDDIDWRAGVLTIRGKGLYHDQLPLPHDVGEAIVTYPFSRQIVKFTMLGTWFNSL